MKKSKKNFSDWLLDDGGIYWLAFALLLLAWAFSALVGVMVGG